MKIMKYFALGALLIAAAGCSDKFDYPYQSPDNNVYWDFEGNQAAMKNLSYTFFDTPTLESVVLHIPVRISGPRVDHARTFRVMAQAAPSDALTLPDLTSYATAGTNYTLPAEGVIPAGEGVGYVDLTILNTDPAMSEGYFQLKLDLVASADFGVSFEGDPEQKDDTYLNTVTVTFSRLLTMPDWWNSDVQGSWSNDLKAWNSTTNELFRIFTGLTELPLSSASTFQQTLSIIAYFKDAVRNPQVWVADHPDSGYTITASGDDGEGNAKYTFQMDGSERAYEFRVNAAEGNLAQWMNEMGDWAIFY